MTDGTIDISIEEGVLELSLNYPNTRNAVTQELSKSLQEALKTHAEESSVRCIVLSSSTSVFSVGGDITGFAKAAARNQSNAPQKLTYEGKLQAMRRSMDLISLLHEIPKPTIAVINGAAAGGGLSLALACDYRMVAKEAKLTTAFANMAVAGDFGAAYFLSHIVGPYKARDILYSGELISTEEALQLGLVSKIYDREDLKESAMSFARRLAQGPTVAYGYMKKNTQLALTQPLNQYLDAEAEHMMRTFYTKDHAEAAKAFISKTKPVFNGH